MAQNQKKILFVNYAKRQGADKLDNLEKLDQLENDLKMNAGQMIKDALSGNFLSGLTNLLSENQKILDELKKIQ